MSTATTAAPAEQDPGAGFTEAHVDIDNFTVRYYRAGQGDPVVVLHGAGGPRFTRALDLLAQRRQVVLVEMPGFGEQVNDIHQTPDELAEAVAQAIEEIGLTRYHLLGTSLGGSIAARLASAHPDRVVSLVLEAPAAFREGAVSPADIPPEEMAGRFRVFPDRVPALTPPDPEATARVWPLVDRVLGTRPVDDPELAEKLPGLNVRTLVLFGDRDGVIPPHNGRTYRRLMPNCSLIFVHQAAHDIQGDRAEAFAEVVADFLDRGWQFLLPEQSTVINP
jgi:pimeloyl-ACP methyl ester carboxylesterase